MSAPEGPQGHAPTLVSGARPYAQDALRRVAGARPCFHQCQIMPVTLEPEIMEEQVFSRFRKRALECPADQRHASGGISEY